MPVHSTIINSFKFNASLFTDKVFTLTEEQASYRIKDDVNPTKWLAGHLTGSRSYVLNKLGVEREYEYAEVFKGGFDSSKTYPTMDELKKEFDAITAQLMEALGNATEEQLQNELGFSLPNGAEEIGDSLSFWVYHEGLHLGQISIIRKCLGLDGVLPF